MSSNRRAKSKKGARLGDIGDVTSPQGVIASFASSIPSRVKDMFGRKRKPATPIAMPKRHQERQPPPSLRQKRPRLSHNRNDDGPLARAQKIQDEQSGYNRNNFSKRRDKFRRSTSQSESPLVTSSRPPSSMESRTQSRRNKKNFTYQYPQITVDLCDENDSETSEECNKNKKTSNETSCTPRFSSSPSPSRQQRLQSPCSLAKGNSAPRESKTKYRSGRSRIREHTEKERIKQPPGCPAYPTTRCSEPVVSTPTKEGAIDDGTDSIVSQAGSPVRTLSQLIDLQGQPEKMVHDCHSKQNGRKALSLGNGTGQDNGRAAKKQSICKTINTQNTEGGKEGSSDFHVESSTDEREKPIPRKRLPPKNTSFPMQAQMQIPELKKKIMHRQKKHRGRQSSTMKSYEDIDDTNEVVHDQEDGGCGRSQTSWIDNMNDVVKSAEQSDAGDFRRVIPRSTRASNNCADSFLPDCNTTNSSFNSLNLVKANNKKRAQKPNRKKTAKKIVPGAALQKERAQDREGDSQQRHWRDKGYQDESAVNWNPTAGDYYKTATHRKTRSDTARQRRQYGALSGASTDASMDPSPSAGAFSDTGGRAFIRRSKRNKKQKTPETIDIVSSESEDDPSVTSKEEEPRIVKLPLKRLVVDQNKILRHEDVKPFVRINTEKLQLTISFFNSKDRSKGNQEMIIEWSDVEEMTYFYTDGMNVDDIDLENFVSLRCDARFVKGTQRSERNVSLTLEFQNDQQHQGFIDSVVESTDSVDSASPGKIHQGQPLDAQPIAAPLIEDSKKQYNLRNRVAPHKTDSFTAGRKSDEILLVYPFCAEKKKIEAAAKDLNELAWRAAPESEILDTAEQSKSHYIEIRVEDYEKLNSKEWLNDSLVDLWMQWISRDISCKQSSNVHFFTSHFYTTLASEGAEGVKSWTARKQINIFDKRLIFIPINKSLHWSLCVVVNPGAIIPAVDIDDANDRPLPCILFFDSLDIHRKAKFHKDIMKWLNYEWKRVKNETQEPFNKTTCKIYDPQVPRQSNGWDCGVFVCRYAFAMFQLRAQKFSAREAGIDELDQATSPRARKAFRSRIFSDLVTRGDSFRFDGSDIKRIRSEFQTLIRNLEPLYKEAKVDKIRAEREEKKSRRELRRKEKQKTTAPSNPKDSSRESANDSSDSAKENHLSDEEKTTKKTEGPNGVKSELVYGTVLPKSGKHLFIDDTAAEPKDSESEASSIPKRSTKIDGEGTQTSKAENEAESESEDVVII